MQEYMKVKSFKIGEYEQKLLQEEQFRRMKKSRHVTSQGELIRIAIVKVYGKGKK